MRVQGELCVFVIFLGTVLHLAVASQGDPLEDIQASLKRAATSGDCPYDVCCAMLREEYEGKGEREKAMVAAGSSGVAPDWGSFSACRKLGATRYCMVERMSDLPPRFQFYSVNVAVDAQALCVPAECSAGMIQNMLDSHWGSTLVAVECSSGKQPGGLLGAIALWGAVAMLGLIVFGQLAAATVYYCTGSGRKGKTQPYMQSGSDSDTCEDVGEYVSLREGDDPQQQAPERLTSTTEWQENEGARLNPAGIPDAPSTRDGSLPRPPPHAKVKQGVALVLYAFAPQEGVARILEAASVTGMEGVEEGRWHLGILDGVRALSFLWLTLGQTCLFIMPYLSNTEYFLNEVLTQFAVQPVVAASLGGDMFLYLSGFVTCMGLLRVFIWHDGWSMKAVGATWIRRFVRLYPSYVVVLVIYTILLPRLGDAPLWERLVVDPADYCRDTWWSNLLFLSNFTQEATRECFPGSWYLSMMMQLTLLAPAFVFFYHKSKLLGWIVILTATLGVHVFVTYTSLTHGYSMNFFAGAHANEKYWKYIFTQTIPRSSVFLAGIFSGFLVHQSGWGSKGINRYIAMVMHTTGIVTVGFQCLGQAGDYEHGPDGPHFAHWQQALYLASARFLIVGAVGKMLTLAITGNGFMCTPFLSSRVFRIASPLLYSACLIQPVVLTWLYGTLQEPIPFSYGTVLAYWCGSTTLTLVLATMLYVSVERPFRVLADAILPDRPLPTRAPMRDPSKVRSLLLDP